MSSMRPRSSPGIAPPKLAIWLAVALLAAGAVASTGVVGHDAHGVGRLNASVYSLPAPFDLRPSCLVVTIDPSAACPLPAIPVQPRTRPPTIVLCSVSLCGRGFRPGDTILLLATRAEGSTFWRIGADRNGNFRSPLPSPLCRFAPIDLDAYGNHGERSNRLFLASVGCRVFGP